MVTIKLSQPEPSIAGAGLRAAPNIGSVITSGLNPQFLRARAVVVIDRSDTQLVVGSVEPPGADVIAALRFASGLAIEAVILSAEDFARHLARFEPACVSAGSATDTRPQDSGDDAPITRIAVENAAFALPNERAESLFERAASALRSPPSAALALLPLARLIEAGLTSQDAGQALLAISHDAKNRIAPSLVPLAEALAQGRTLDDAIALVPDLPDFMLAVMEAAHCEEDRASAIGRIADWIRIVERRNVNSARLATELAVSAAAAAVFAFTIALAAGFIMAAAAILAVSHARLAVGRRALNNGVRAEVLFLVATLAQLRLPVTVIVRAGAAYLAGRLPTWGRLPDTREGLADALGLDAVSRIVLLSGELKVAAHRVAAVLDASGEDAERRIRWFARGAVFVTACCALVVHLLR